MEATPCHSHRLGREVLGPLRGDATPAKAMDILKQITKQDRERCRSRVLRVRPSRPHTPTFPHPSRCVAPIQSDPGSPLRTGSIDLAPSGMCGRRSASAAELVRSEYNSDLITLQRSPNLSRERHGGPRVRKQWTCPATVREVAPVSAPERLGIGSRVPCHGYRVVSDRHIASVLKDELVQEVPLGRPVEQLVLASFGVEEADAPSAPKTTSSAARLVSLDHVVEFASRPADSTVRGMSVKVMSG